MKQIKIFFPLFFLLSLVLGGTVFAVQTIEIDSIYATSTQEPIDSNVAENVLTGSGNGWVPKNGLSSGEGIMIYFSKKINLKEIKIDVVEGGNSQSALYSQAIIGYINGSEQIFSQMGYVFSDRKEIPTEQWLRGLQGKEIVSVFFKLNGDVGSVKKITFYDSDSQIMETVFPSKVKGKVEASSILSPYTAYKPNNLFDSKFETAWVEGADGSGNGQTLKFNFDNEVKITKIKIWNGYQRSLKHFNANEKVSEFSFGKADDTALSVYSVKNSMTAQEIALKTPLTGNQFVLNINKIYSGANYKDLAISEILFFDGERWFKLQPTDIRSDIDKATEKTRGSFLAGIIDKNIFVKVGNANSWPVINFILRSDGTFAYWFQTDSGGVSNTYVADGNWEALDGNGKIRVFGRYKLIENIYIPYSPSVQNSKEEIFQDILTITEKEISSNKLFKGKKGYTVN